MHTNQHGGMTYFERWGFSINEGVFPNIHISWRNRNFYFYIALARRIKWHFNMRLPFNMVRRA